MNVVIETEDFSSSFLYWSVQKSFFYKNQKGPCMYSSWFRLGILRYLLNGLNLKRYLMSFL